MNKLDTTNLNNYEYTTEYLKIHILGGMKTTKLETLRIPPASASILLVPNKAVVR